MNELAAKFYNLIEAIQTQFREYKVPLYSALQESEIIPATLVGILQVYPVLYTNYARPILQGHD